uniref:Tf2-1-like SH3-like domain-containing protein n=1 Tax=Moniliophthora roreri TaxID=221103 RepID=A0A0W0F903_MONRR
MGYPSKKLAPKREGLFKVLEVLRPVTYKLDLLHQWKIHPVFHATLLSPFKETEAHGLSFTEPPPDLIEGFEEYKVEAVVGHRLKKQPREFLVSYTGNGYPRPDITDTRSLISRLTAKPVVNEAGLPAAIHSTSEPDDTLIYPDSTPDPDVKPKVEHLKPQFHPKVEHIPAVGGEVALEESEDVVEDEERENRIPESNDGPPMPSLRNPTPAPTPIMQLVNHVSALCADWSAILPDIAHSTCAIDASKFNLDIHLATALTNEGLAVLCTEGLIQAQTLCQMVAVMTMNETTIMSPTTISAENVEMLTDEYDRDAQLLFVGTDPKKVRLLSVEERQAMGWQLNFNVSSMPRLGTVDEMPDTSYDYDMELYGDGES